MSDTATFKTRLKLEFTESDQPTENLKLLHGSIDSSLVIHGDFLKGVYFYHIINSLSPVVQTVLDTMRKNLDFLGYQLDHAQGNITDDVFENIADEHFQGVTKFDNIELKNMVHRLSYLYHGPFDAETMSDLFNCEVDQAEEVLSDISMGLIENE